MFLELHVKTKMISEELTIWPSCVTVNEF